jgi:hypothetical protein
MVVIEKSFQNAVSLSQAKICFSIMRRNQLTLIMETVSLLVVATTFCGHNTELNIIGGCASRTTRGGVYKDAIFHPLCLVTKMDKDTSSNNAQESGRHQCTWPCVGKIVWQALHCTLKHTKSLLSTYLEH